MSIMRDWHEKGELARVRSWYTEQTQGRLDDAITSSLRRMPMPSLLHRVSTADFDLPSGGRILKGKRVVVGLVPAADGADDDALLFGHGTHACTGKDMAMAVLRGLVTTLLANDRIHRGASARALSWDLRPTP